jgi:hypothetical protein
MVRWTALEQPWGERTPRTQIVAIGAAGSIEADLLEAIVTSCITGPTSPLPT